MFEVGKFMQIDSRTHTHTVIPQLRVIPQWSPGLFGGGKCPCRATVGWAQATTKWPRPWPRPWKPQESSHVLACFNLYQKYVHLKPLIPSLVEKQYYYIYIYYSYLKLPTGLTALLKWRFGIARRQLAPLISSNIYIYIPYTYIYLYIYMTPFQISQAR